MDDRRDNPSQPSAGAAADADTRARQPSGPCLDLADDPRVLDWDRYRLLDLLGRGGMGWVYRASDLVLEREVALKFLRHDDPEMAARFRREARTQAQVDHPNVCRVYEVGEVGGHPFIAMQLIRGPSLMEAGLRMTIPDKIRVAAEVARGVHAAHERGLVHRDLKPGNVLVEWRDGAWHPFVVDFGIARTAHDLELTEPGTIMGTLAYVPPEQARGAVGELDRRSDVYSLGATVYALFAGVPPFPQGGGADTLWRVVHEEPLRLRRRTPEVPRDLETVVMACLEKDPSRRYSTAGELADDLERCLRGEPVHARPVGPAGRLLRRVRRRPGLAAAIAAAVLIAVAAVSVNLATVHRARLRGELANRLAQQVAEDESQVRLAALLPLHDRSAERAELRGRLVDLERRTASLGRWAEGPASFAIGRGHLLLDEPRQAVDRLEVAWEDGYRSPLDALALGRAYGALYREALQELEQIEEPAQRVSFAEEIQRQFRDRALEILALAGDAPSLPSAWVEGLVAFYDGRPEDALERARAAFERAPWLHEAKVLEGDAELAVARARLDRGDFHGCLEAADRAQAAFETAAQVARSDADTRRGLCSLHGLRMELALRTGGDPEPPFGAAEAACGEALVINPEGVPARNLLARANWLLADALSDRGLDPSRHLARAERLALEAVELEPANLYAHYNLGCALSIAGVGELGLGRDPRPLLRRAVASFERAVEISPGFAPARDDLGYAWERSAKYELQRGLDPTPSLDRAVASYQAAIRLTPAFANAHNNLGIARLRRALWLAASGGDPGPELDAAEEDLERAVELNPNYANAHANLGFVARARAADIAARRRDPREALAAARAAFARAHAINPSLPWSWPELAAVELVEARWSRARGARHERAIAAAEAAARRAIELNPRNPVAFLRAAEVDLERIRAGDRSAPVAERGLGRSARALELNPDMAEAMLVRAELLALVAEAPLQRLEARRLTTRALELNPTLASEASGVRTLLAG